VVTNIEEDGTVPSPARTNWLEAGLNNFRQNKQPGLEFAAADAVVSVTGSCELEGIVFKVTVRNVGEASMARGVRVELVADPAGTPRLLTTLTTTRALPPTQSETLTYTTTAAAAGNVPVIARIVGTTRECRTDNNTSEPPVVACIN
jgi:hypothetical protein